MTETVSSHHNNRLYKNLAILGIIFSVAGVIVLILWLHYWRYEEITDDAYVNGNRIDIVSQIDGRVISYYADNTDYVAVGELLVQLDRKDFEIAFQQQMADLGQTIREVKQLIERTKEQQAILEQRRVDYDNTRLEYHRRKEIVQSGAVAVEDFTNSLAAMDEAFAAIEAAELELKALLAVSQVASVAEHPLVISGIQSVKQRYLDLQRTTLYAPVSGFVAQRACQVGQWATTSDTLLSIIPYDQVWVDANYKETQLANVRIGQNVILISDIYGSDALFRGSVVGIGAGTGSVFSILPPQNATGNWIKIVQRVPVKISLDIEQIKEFPLALGLSMTTTIDTHDRSGERVSQIPPSKEVQTTIYKNELAGIDEIIQKILRENGAFEP